MDAGSSAAAGVDVGGTFTDVVVVDPGRDRPPRAVKVPTTPHDQSEGLLAGLRAAGGAGVGLVAHGTTTATNAILERAVARTALVTTAGFRDVLLIGRQDRPSLYDLDVVRPAPLVADGEVVTVDERTAPDGRPLVPLSEDEVERVVAAVAALDVESVAISLLFAYAGAAHEERLAAALAGRLGVPVTRSSVLLPEFREYERASTCVLNAAVAPVMRRYLAGLRKRLGDIAVTVMTSGGGTAGVTFAAEAPVHTLLSGPAAGVVAAAAVAQAAGFPDAVAFDMGGTSTDVCLIRAGRPDVASEASIGGMPFRTPSVAIHTVGAGGGSIAHLDAGGALRVGPRSAGARPGPACYGLGGREPTVTDAHCLLGHLDPDRPLGGGADSRPGTTGGGLRLDAEAAIAALARLPGAAAGPAGVLTVVQATMLRALRRVTTERGVDPSGLALVAYGGAGPLHATALARALGCAAVVVPPAPGVLSALGLLLAPPRYESAQTVLAPAGENLERVWDALERAARAELAAQRVSGPVTTGRVADCRYAGQSHELRVDAPRGEDLAAALHAAHERAYGYRIPGEPVQVVTLRVVAEAPPVLAAPPARWDQGPPAPERRRRIGVPRATGAGVVWEETDARVLQRAALHPGDVVDGPALVEQPDTTTLLGPGESATVDVGGHLVVRWEGGR